MAYRAVVDIPRKRDLVWGVLTDASAWSDWWGGPVAGVEPRWEIDGTVAWGDGGTATITAFAAAELLELVSASTGTRWSFQLSDGPGSGTRFTFVEDFSDSRVKIGERDAKLAANESTATSFRDAVVERIPAPRKWWRIWG